jgi:glycosyltransferase involved in cell wall biosynthesis
MVPERFDIGAPTPCAYIRLIQPLSHPAITSDFDVSLADSETVLEQPADIIVTQRYAIPDSASAERLADHARKIGAKLVYDLDDDLLNVPKNHPDAQELRPLAKVVRDMVTLADTIWVSTPALANSLKRLRPDAELIENRLDERIWAARPAAPPSRESPVRILAMGTTSHEHDFDLILPALKRLKIEYDERVVVEILGMTSRTDLPKGLLRVGPPRHAMASYPTFVHWLTSVEPPWHIGLAPLLETPFNACKSPIKAMDYAALGLAVVASDTDVYCGSIADGPAGRLVPNTPEAWYAALDGLVRDAVTRGRMMAAARDAFADHASLSKYAPVRREALRKALQAGASITVSAA